MEIRQWETEELQPLSKNEWKYIAELVKNTKGKPDQEMRVLRYLKHYDIAEKKDTYSKFLRFLSGYEDLPKAISSRNNFNKSKKSS